MGKFIITEEDKKHIMGLYEQNNILSTKGYVLSDVNKLSGKQKDVVTKLIGRYPTYKYYTKGDVSLISDGKEVIFIVAPQGWGKGLGPHPIESI